LMTLASAFDVTVLKEAVCASGLNCREATSQLTLVARNHQRGRHKGKRMM
jgi:hypothetical protein